MKKFTTIVSALALTLVIGLTAGVSSFANGADKANAPDAENRDAIEAAVASGDYTAWKTLVTSDERGTKIAETITAENFPRFAEAHGLMQEAKAKMQEAKMIFDELGIKGPMHKGHFHGKFKHGDDHRDKSEEGKSQGRRFGPRGGVEKAPAQE